MNEWLEQARAAMPEWAHLPDTAFLRRYYDRFHAEEMTFQEFRNRVAPQEEAQNPLKFWAGKGLGVLNDLGEGAGTLLDILAQVGRARHNLDRGIRGMPEAEAGPLPSQRIAELIPGEGNEGLMGTIGRHVGAGLSFGAPLGPMGMVAGAGGGVASGVAEEAMDAVGVPLAAQIPVMMAAGGGGASATGRVVNAARNNLVPGASQYLDDAASMGVRPRAGDALGPESLVRRMEDALEATGTPQTVRAMRQQADEMQGAVRNVADDVRPDDLPPDVSPDRYVAQRLRDRYLERKAEASKRYDAARALSGDDQIGLSSAMGAVDDMAEEFALLGPSVQASPVGNVINQIKAWSKDGGLTYRQADQLLRILGAEVRSLRAGGPGTDQMMGAAKKLIGAINDDLDQWARQGNRPAHSAHLAARNYFRENVAPFERNRVIHEIVDSDPRPVPGVPSGLDAASEGLIRKVVGYGGEGKPENAKLLLGLLDDNGKRAVAFDILDKAAVEGSDQYLSGFSPSRTYARLNQRTPERPSAARVVMDESGVGDEVGSLGRMLKATERSTAASVQPKTGYRLMPNIGRSIGALGPSAGLGAAAFGAYGAPMSSGAAAGALLAPAVGAVGSRAMGAALNNPAVIKYLLAQKGNPVPGLLTGATQGRKR